MNLKDWDSLSPDEKRTELAKIKAADKARFDKIRGARAKDLNRTVKNITDHAEELGFLLPILVSTKKKD